MKTTYDLRIEEKALAKTRKERQRLENEFVKRYKEEFLLSYLLPLSATDYEIFISNVKMVQLLIKKNAMSEKDAISRQEIVTLISPEVNNLQDVFNENRKFSPIAAGVLGSNSSARRTVFFIKDHDIALKWLVLMSVLV